MRQLAVSSLSKGISSTLTFHMSIGTDMTVFKQNKTKQNPKIKDTELKM